MGPAGSQVPINGKNPPNRVSSHNPAGPVHSDGEDFLNKGPIVLQMNCQASGQACSLGVDLWWKLNNATALRGGHVPSQGGRLS